MHYLTVLSFMSFVVFSANGECNFPPNLWCENKEIATKCQVLEQCNQYVWLKLNTHTDVLKVNFTVYIESLCPDCKNFIKSQLYSTWQKVGDIMNLTLVPYGNAQENYHDGRWEYRCQHGVEECVGNVIETCAITYYEETKQHFPFIYCLETSSAVPNISASECAKMHGLNYDKIMMCANGILGNWLEHRMAALTEKLNPPHKYVPWVTLNGVHTEDIQKKAQSNLLKLICDAYMGKKPDACDEKL